MTKKTTTKIIRYLNAGIFPPIISLSYQFSHAELVKEYNKAGATEWAAGIADEEVLFKSPYLALRRDTEHPKHGNKTLFYIIIQKQFTFSDWDMVMLAHEVLHITQFMMKDILDPEREYEAVAYTHSHIMSQCLKELREAEKPKQVKRRVTTKRKS